VFTQFYLVNTTEHLKLKGLQNVEEHQSCLITKRFKNYGENLIRN
jgi:hypothetical protein